MKATELMIGDWVSTPNGYRQVKQNFGDDGICTRLVPEYNHSEEWDEKDIDPIPLTQEILEKNGFTFERSGRGSMLLITPFREEGIRYNIYVGLKDRTIDVHAAHPEELRPGWRKRNNVNMQICGPYVHELQHALRLCGIEKEINVN